MKLIKSEVKILDKLNGEEIINRIAAVARTCYKSEASSTPESDKALVERLINSNHFAMIEFADVTVKFICSRSISHEIVRHRLMSFAMESQRYCNYSKDKFNNEITFILPTWYNQSEDEIDKEDFRKYLADCESYYNNLINKRGFLAQEAREILPNATKTEINCKANLREWIHFLTLRCSTAAHPDIRVLALDLLKQLHEQIPVIFDKLYDKYYGR